MVVRLVRARWFLMIIAAHAVLFACDIATPWDDISVGFLYVVPTLATFFVGETRQRVVLVLVAVVLIVAGGVYTLPDADRLLPFALNRALAVITILITGVLVHSRVRLEHSLSVALEREQRAAAMQRAFVSMVSHEFRTPLTIIDAEAYRMLKTKDSVTAEVVERRALSIRDAAQRMIKLIEKILYTSRAYDNRITIKICRVNLWNLIRDIARQHGEVSTNHQIVLDLYAMPVSIRADGDLLIYVFDNLIGNAVKYSPPGGRIDICGRAEGSGVAVVVRDHGIGVPSADQAFLFEPYFRAGNARALPGSGIGLYLVDRFVRMHGGRVTVESEEGTGSIFTVYLPAVPPDVSGGEDGCDGPAGLGAVAGAVRPDRPRVA